MKTWTKVLLGALIAAVLVMAYFIGAVIQFFKLDWLN